MTSWWNGPNSVTKRLPGEHEALVQLAELRKLLLEPLDAMLHFDPTPSVEARGDVQKLAVLLSDLTWPAQFIGNLHKVLFQLERDPPPRAMLTSL